MGWSLQTWLVGTLFLCIGAAWDETERINKLFRDGDTGNNSAITSELVEKRITRYREVRLVCGCLATFALLTYLFFVY